MAGLYKNFDGERFIFDSWHERKYQARMKAKKLREQGYKVRVVAGSSSYKPHYGSQGYRVYKRK